MGETYTAFRRLVEESYNWSVDQRITYTVQYLNRIKEHSISHFKFYESLYAEYGVSSQSIKDISDWNKLPLISKELLRGRLDDFNGYQKINTGGTSGQPFAFYIDKKAWSREWAHMHAIWELKRYHFTLPKLTLRGKELGTKVFAFNPVHNEFIVNTYLSFEDKSNAETIKKIIKSKKIQFLHGYPSAIFNFLNEMERALDRKSINELKQILRVCLLGSEFPIPYMTEYLEKVWNLDYISWYGHSEMCILAYDLYKQNKYYPFPTYGFAESVNSELIGTSFHNMDMPLLRYRTGDLIEDQIDNGILTSFSVKEGRSGDFIEDETGKNISLTALIFGRHHAAFEVFDFVQVSQTERGKATIFATSKKDITIEDLPSFFDFTGVKIHFTYKILKQPILSKAGKFKLKV